MAAGTTTDRLTKIQHAYLRAMYFRDSLQQGWGGMSSRRVIRRLEELGLCRTRYGPGPWAASITDKGRRVVRDRLSNEGHN